MGNLFKKPKQQQPARSTVKPKPVVNPREPIREAGKDDDDPKRRRGYGGGGAAASGTILAGLSGGASAGGSRKTLLGD